MVSETQLQTEFEANYFGIEWIETEKLFIDQNYQRPISHSLIKSMTSNWDWRAVRTLAVSMRSDDTYAVMDGQQRLTAARENNIEKLPCQVYLDLNPTQEAELFLKLNNSRKPNANDMFRAKLAQGDQAAKMIAIVVERTGWEFDLENTHSTQNNFAAYWIHSAPSVVSVYETGGVRLLTSVLQICHAWKGQHMAASADVILALGDFLNKHRGNVEISKLTEKLSSETPSGMIGKAGQVMAAEKAIGIGGRSTRRKGLYRVLVATYNKGLRTDNRLEE